VVNHGSLENSQIGHEQLIDIYTMYNSYKDQGLTDLKCEFFSIVLELG